MLGTVRDDFKLAPPTKRTAPYEFYKVLAKGMSISRYGPRLNSVAISAYKQRPVLYVLLSRSMAKSRSSYRGIALVDFLNNDAERMQARNGPIEAEDYADSRSQVPPPHPKGRPLTFVDSFGSGTLLYWDGVMFRWYPVGKP